MQATLEEIAEHGFQHSSVTGITKRARVSRTTFYDNFNSKTEAFAQAHIEAVSQLADILRSLSETAAPKTWRERVELGVSAYLSILEDSPQIAYCFLVELRAAGEPLRAQTEFVMGSHARLLVKVAERALASGEDVRVPTPAEALAVMGGTDELTAREIRTFGRGAKPKLSRLVEPITQLPSAILLPE